MHACKSSVGNTTPILSTSGKRRKPPMLKHKLDFRKILHLFSLFLLLINIFTLVESVDCTNGSPGATYYASDYNILNGTYLSGNVPASVQSVDSDYLLVGSFPSDTSVSTYSPSAYNLLGSTAYVSGALEDLVSDNDVYMTFRSYAQSLYSHQETTNIGGVTYNLLKLSSADAAGTTLSADAGNTTGRRMMGKFVYQLTGVSSIPASTWTIHYRAYRGNPTIEAHGDVDILIRMSNGTVRTTIATDVANSGALTTSWSTVSGTYSWAAYTVVNQTDYLEIDYYIEVTSPKAGYFVNLRIDDNTLTVTDQTSATNICLLNEHTMEVEFTGSSNTNSWTQLVWSVDSAWTTDSVTVVLQLYNYTLGAYPKSGNGFVSYNSSATTNTDETKAQIITANPQHFCDARGDWKIKVKGVKSTNAQFDLRADWIEFKPTYYNEYTVSTEFLFSSMATNTPPQLNFIVVSEYDTAGVYVIIQVWNYSSSAYETSGQGCLTYIASGANETKLLSINSNPQFYTSNGNAKIKITGVLSPTTQFQQEINQIKLVYSDSAVAYIHDVAILNVTVSSTDVFSGQVVNVSVVVKNNGIETETFNVTLFYDENVIGTKTVTNLASGDQKTLEFTWNTAGLGAASYEIQAEANAVSGEIETSNNAYTGAIVKVSTQTSFWPFDAVTTLSYGLPIIFGLLFIFGLNLKRKKKAKDHVERKTDAFSEQFGMTHQQIIGKKMLLEIDPTSSYQKSLLGFTSEAGSNNEPLFIFTNRNSTLHSALFGVEKVNFRLLTSKTSSPRQISNKEILLPASDLSVLLDAVDRIQKGHEKPINVVFDNLSDIILRCGFEKTYRFTRLLLETISSSKTTIIFVFNPKAHDEVISSSIRGLFENQIAYTKNGPKVGTF